MMPLLSFSLRPFISYRRRFSDGLRGICQKLNRITSSNSLICKSFYATEVPQSSSAQSQQSQSSAARILASDAIFVNIDLNASQQFADIESVARNVKRRNMNIDVGRLYAQYRQLQKLLKEKIYLEQQRSDNAEIVKMLVKNDKQNSKHIDECKRKGRDIKSRLKSLVDGPYKTLQENVTSEVLSLPVYLHRTVSESDETIHEVGSPPLFQFSPSNHVTLANSKDSPEFWSTSDGSYYLTGKLSKLERHLVNGLSDYFLASGMRKIICPDMVKSVVTDACFACSVPDNAGHYSLEGKAFEESSLRLTGTSAATFAAFLASQNILSSSLPLKYFSIGRSYSTKHDVDCGLFSVRQTTLVDVFAAAESEKNVDELFDEYSELVYSVYNRLNLPFKFVKVRCADLSRTESRRTDVYVWSTGYGRYFKCGSLCSHGDYVSRRLTTKHAVDIDDATRLDFAYTLHGTVVKIPSIIAGLVEQYQREDGSFQISLPRLKN